MDGAKQVRITLQVTGGTDRDPWEWGAGLAAALEADLAQHAENADVWVECTDVETLSARLDAWAASPPSQQEK